MILPCSAAVIARFVLNTGFKALPGNYIYAGQEEDGSWIPIYIAATRDLHQRLEGHVTLVDAMANGATHLQAHYCTAGQGGSLHGGKGPRCPLATGLQ